MNNNNMTSVIIVLGIIVLGVFAAVLSINLMPDYESKSYYVKIEDEMNAKIESLDIKDDKLIITTSGESKEYCVKPTRTAPEANNMCWKKIINNVATISIYKDKKYYVWIKDTNDNISIPMSINTKEN